MRSNFLEAWSCFAGRARGALLYRIAVRLVGAMLMSGGPRSQSDTRPRRRWGSPLRRARGEQQPSIFRQMSAATSSARRSGMVPPPRYTLFGAPRKAEIIHPYRRPSDPEHTSVPSLSHPIQSAIASWLTTYVKAMTPADCACTALTRLDRFADATDPAPKPAHLLFVRNFLSRRAPCIFASREHFTDPLVEDARFDGSRFVWRRTDRDAW